MLNSDGMNRSAAAFAARVVREQPEDRLAQAVLLAFARPITADERVILQTFLDEQRQRYLEQRSEPERQTPDALQAAADSALTDLCHMLLSANEFIYID